MSTLADGAQPVAKSVGEMGMEGFPLKWIAKPTSSKAT